MPPFWTEPKATAESAARDLFFSKDPSAYSDTVLPDKESPGENKKGKLRDARDVFVVEGPRMFREAPKERIEKIYISERY